MNPWHVMTCPVALSHRPEHVQSPFFTHNRYRDEDSFVIVHQHYSRGESMALCQAHVTG